MKPSPTVARRVVATVAIACSAGIAACGSSPAPSPRPTVTVTVTAPAPASSPAVTATPTATQTGPAGCATTALTASLGAGSGTAGSTYYPIEFTNSSGSACSLYGYPGVSFVTAGGAQIGAAASEDPTYARKLVTLAPGAAAHADLRVVDAQNYPASTCHPVTAHRLKIYPPGETSALSISFTATACSSPSVEILSVQTVQPGTGS